jgi:hypothetical protein
LSQGIVPEEFLCPITLELMTDPVVAEDGHTYERSAITDWFANGNGLSPKTQAEMGQVVTPNYSLRALIASLGGQSGEARTGGVEPERAVDSELKDLLASLNLQQYLHSFVDHGYDELSDVRDVAVEELVEDVKMKVGHARRLVKHFARS